MFAVNSPFFTTPSVSLRSTATPPKEGNEVLPVLTRFTPFGREELLSVEMTVVLFYILHFLTFSCYDSFY